MKKIFFSMMLLLVSVSMMTAQTVIRNNQDNAGSSATQSSSDKIGAFNLQFMSFDGFQNYGIADYFINPNGLGGEFGLRMNPEKHGNYNIDLGLNYAFQVLDNDDFGAFLVLAIGPSLRIQDEFDKIDKRGNVTYKTGFNVDGFINPRVSLKFNHLLLTAGYFYWAPEFKFSKDDGGIGGFNASLGWAF